MAVRKLGGNPRDISHNTYSFFLEEMIIMTKTRMNKLNKVAKLRKRHLCLLWEAKQARPLTMTPNQ